MSRQRKVNRIQTAPEVRYTAPWEDLEQDMDTCPYDLDSFERFDVEGGRGRISPYGAAFLAFTKDRRTGTIRARLSLSKETVDSMHAHMEFDDRVEYRVSETARVIALLPSENGVKLSYPTEKKKRGNRASVSVGRACELLRKMFGNCHFVLLTPKYYNGSTIFQPTGKTIGELE